MTHKNQVHYNEVYCVEIDKNKCVFSSRQKLYKYITMMRQKGFIDKDENVKVDAILLDYQYETEIFSGDELESLLKAQQERILNDI